MAGVVNAGEGSEAMAAAVLNSAAANKRHQSAPKNPQWGTPTVLIGFAALAVAIFIFVRRLDVFNPAGHVVENVVPSGNVKVDIFARHEFKEQAKANLAKAAAP